MEWSRVLISLSNTRNENMNWGWIRVSNKQPTKSNEQRAKTIKQLGKINEQRATTRTFHLTLT